MKKFIVLIVSFLGFFTSNYASHLAGGEIGWECLSSGQYRFSMVVFRDCTGIPFTYQNETMYIRGNPLPTNGSGSVVSTVTLKPDSNRWVNNNNGDTSPQCKNGNGWSCSAGDNGTIQAFWFVSDPITLNGTPPGGGWTFSWQAPPARSDLITNIFGNGARQGLQARMFPLPNNQNANPCYDSSPIFKGLPVSSICRNYTFTYNHTAVDADLDSLVYFADRAYNQGTAGGPLTPVPYRAPYTFQNPTPTAAQNANNIPYTVDPLTGVTRLAIYSGNGVQKFATAVRVDAYREGVVIASVFRELNVAVTTCPPLDNTTGIGGTINNPPKVFIDGQEAESTTRSIVAGQAISIPIQVVDDDITNTGLQVVTLVPDGLMFTNDKVPSTNPAHVTPREKGQPCQVPGVTPCAYLQGLTPAIDPVQVPTVYSIRNVGSLQSEFVWQTDCKHIQTCTGQPGTNEGIYNFVMRVLDDHCPLPAINYPTITVRVKDPIPLTEPIMKGISVNLDGSVNYNWVPPIDSAADFFEYQVQGTRVPPNFPLSGWQTVNLNVKNYEQSRRAANYPVYELINPFGPADGPVDLFRILGTTQNVNNDFYMRMRSVSGCTDTVKSIYSEPARVMELDVVPSGVGPIDPPRSRARLSWNRPKPLNSGTYPYFEYESPTRYYIHVNDSAGANGSSASAGISDPNNWYIAGSTTDTTFEVPSSVCGDYVAFRIEARDSVTTWRQGNHTRNRDSLHTLTYSTFSLMDTLFMITNNFIRVPNFDTVMVQTDGSLLLRIDLSDKGTTSMYNVYENSVSSANLLGSILGNEDSLVVTPMGDALTQNINLILEAVNGCDTSAAKREQSAVYNTFIPRAVDGPLCTGTFIIDWDKPGGFPLPTGQTEGVVGYRVYVDYPGTPGFELVTTIMGANTLSATVGGITAGESYAYRVVAFDAVNDVIVSSTETYVAPIDVRNDDIVPAPEARCTYVNEDGSVTLSWIPAVDTSNNFAHTSIRWRNAGATTWNTVSRLLTDTLKPTDSVFTVSSPTTGDLFAQDRQIEFELNTWSGCDSTALHPNPSIISSVFLTVTPRANDPLKQGDGMWNSTGVDYTSSRLYDFHKEDVNGGVDGYTSPYLGTAPYNSNVFLDPGNADLCGDTVDYFVSLDNTDAPRYGCSVRSNLSRPVYTDGIVPPPHNLKFISFNLMTRGFDAYYQDTTRVDRITLIRPDGLNSGLPQYSSISGVFTIDSLGGTLANIFVPYQQLDGRDSSIEISSVAISPCGTPSSESNYFFHRSMDVDVEFVVCDSANIIRWNPYVGFGEGNQISYEVYVSNNGTNWTSLNAGNLTTDTTFTDIAEIGGVNYWYHVRASTAANPSYISNSNIDSIIPVYPQGPLYGYLKYATVAEDESVNIEYFRDTSTLVNGYTLFRGEDPTMMQPLDFSNYNNLAKDQDTILFNDISAETNDRSYYYTVTPENECGVLLSPSNFGKTIYLEIEADNEALTNTLRWNRYEDWDSTVSHYNLYRGVDGQPGEDVYKVLAPNSNYRWNEYVDDVYGEIEAVGEFCYRVEAVQGPINSAVVNGFAHNLESAMSSSNIACAVQEPLIYVPNAFAPDGINRTFGPKGQFFDYQLFEMKIYNRWGELVYETRDINKGWNGEMNGKEAALGSYVYMIRIVDANGKERRKKGTVTLIR